jgi:hypothetical protein
LGVIDKAEITEQGLEISGKIFKKHPASSWYINAMKYKPGSIKLSVEGSVVERDFLNHKKIKKAKIVGVALCENPVNPHTFSELVKSFRGEAPESFFEVPEESPMYTPEQVSALLKAMGISQPYGSTPPANLEGGSALQKENMDSKPKAFQAKTDEEKEETKLANKEKKRQEKAKEGKKPKKLVKSDSYEELEAQLESSLDLLQKQFPKESRETLWEKLQEAIENKIS